MFHCFQQPVPGEFHVDPLIKNARVLVTQDAQGRQINEGGLYVRNNVIEQVGKTEELPAFADQVIDARNLAILPGLVNTHHHFWQSLTRAVPGCQNEGLFDWLVRLFPIWADLTDEAVYISTQTAMAEMILSGCTASSDHMYLYPNDATFRRAGARRFEDRDAISCHARLTVVGAKQGRITP